MKSARSRESTYWNACADHPDDEVAARCPSQVVGKTAEILMRAEHDPGPHDQRVDLPEDRLHRSFDPALSLPYNSRSSLGLA